LRIGHCFAARLLFFVDFGSGSEFGADFVIGFAAVRIWNDEFLQQFGILGIFCCSFWNY
jgi:hypothetical protein